MSTRRTITLVEDEDGWTAIDEETGVECSGEDRTAVLERLDDAAAVSFDGEGEAGEDDADLEWFDE